MDMLHERKKLPREWVTMNITMFSDDTTQDPNKLLKIPQELKKFFEERTDNTDILVDITIYGRTWIDILRSNIYNHGLIAGVLRFIFINDYKSRRKV